MDSKILVTSNSSKANAIRPKPKMNAGERENLIFQVLKFSDDDVTCMFVRFDVLLSSLFANLHLKTSDQIFLLFLSFLLKKMLKKNICRQITFQKSPANFFLVKSFFVNRIKNICDKIAEKCLNK